jgi:hypothetical protein
MIAILFFVLSVAGVVGAALSGYLLIKLIRTQFAEDAKR